MVKIVGPLDRDRLRQLLEAHRIDPQAYTLHGGLPNEQYVLDHREAEWLVYYSERGHESGLQPFPTEDLACHHLLNLLLRDSTTRLPQ